MCVREAPGEEPQKTAMRVGGWEDMLSRRVSTLSKEGDLGQIVRYGKMAMEMM